jgi:hypothetical protein
VSLRRAGLVLAATVLTLASRPSATAAPPADPKPAQLHLFGVWPNRLRLFDEATEEFVGDMALKYGAATESTHTPDFSKFYFVTDRMEAIEVVDLKKREVVDTVKLSTQSRQIRIGSVAVNPTGTLLYLLTTPVVLEIDRFLPEESEVFVYDLENKRLRDSFQMPKDVPSGYQPSIHFSPDGSSIFVFGRDIHEIRVSDNQRLHHHSFRSPSSPATGPSGAPGSSRRRPASTTDSIEPRIPS